MFKGWMVFGGLVLAAAVSLCAAQPPARGGDGVAALEAQLDLLKKMTSDVEAKLKAAREAAPKRGFGKGGFPKMDHRKMAERMGRFMGKFGEKKGREKPKDPNAAVEERLDKLAKEIEEIRKSLKK